MIRKREEDQADKWLRENDPYYTAKGKKKRKEKYPYLTPDQEVRRRRKEVPISGLGRADLDYLSLVYGR